MRRFVRLGYLLLIWNIAAVTCVVTFGDSGTDQIVDTQDKLLKTQIEIIRISSDTMMTDKLDDLRARLITLEGEFKKLNELSDVRRGLANGSCDVVIQLLTNHYSSIDSQLKKLQVTLAERAQQDDSKDYLRDIVQAIRNSNFKMADEKLIQMGDITLIPKIVHEVYAKSEKNFSLLVGFAKALSKITSSYEALMALHSEMQKEGHQDPLKLITLSETLESEVIAQQNDPDDIKANAIAIVDALAETIKTSATEFLVKAMEANDYIMNADVHALAEALYTFDAVVSDEVMKRLVDGAFGEVESEKILKNIVSHSNTTQAIAGVNALFWKIKADDDLNNSVVLQIASSISKLRARSEFTRLSQSTKDSVDKVVKNLPVCAKNLYFTESVCLWNKGTNSYLVAATSSYNYDKERRNIFTTISAGNESSFEHAPLGSSWYVVKIDDRILFKSVDFPNEYLYAAAIDHSPKTHYVFGWLRGYNTDIQSAFYVQLHGDQCYLKSAYSDEYMFASEVKYSAKSAYAYVFTRKPGDEIKNALWEIQKC